MKLILSSFVAILFCLPFFVFAQDEVAYESQKFMEEEAAIVKPGVLPNSFWYWADVFAEEIRYIFTVGKEKKIEFLVLLAEERMSEMKALSEEGINNYADELMTKHEVHITRAKELYQQLLDEGKIRAKEFQGELEYEILTNEYKLKNKLRDVPGQYKAGNKNAAQKLKSWFGGILSHLSGKRTEVEDQRLQFE